MSNIYYDPFLALQRKKSRQADFSEKMQRPAGRSCALVRVDTNEHIYIHKPVFRLGKSPQTNDYVINDNIYVGRNHAHLVMENANVFFIDDNSTNKSFINGNQVQPQVKNLLHHQDRITLANLTFVFVTH